MGKHVDVSIFRDLDASGGRKLRTEAHMWNNNSNDNIIIIKISRNAEAHTFNIIIRIYAKLLNMKRML